MAKTTSTTKAKTKTTKKKPAAKAPAKAVAKTKAVSTKAKKTTKSTKATTKPVVKAPTKVTTKTTKSTVKSAAVTKTTTDKQRFSFLKREQVVFGGIFAALAVVAGFFMNTTSVQILLGHLTKDELASSAGTVLAPAAHVLYEVEFRWLVVALLAVVAVLAIARGTRYKATEEAGVTQKVQPMRWLDYGVSTALMFSIAALLNGVQDFVALKLSIIAILVAAYLGWVLEREKAVSGKASRSIRGASVLLTAAPLAFLAVTMVATALYGMERSPWFAYAAAAVVALCMLTVVRTQKNALNQQVTNFQVTDVSLNRVAILTKLAFVAILVFGLYKG